MQDPMHVEILRRIDTFSISRIVKSYDLDLKIHNFGFNVKCVKLKKSTTLVLVKCVKFKVLELLNLCKIFCLVIIIGLCTVL